MGYFVNPTVDTVSIGTYEHLKAIKTIQYNVTTLDNVITWMLWNFGLFTNVSLVINLIYIQMYTSNYFVQKFTNLNKSKLGSGLYQMAITVFFLEP